MPIRPENRARYPKDWKAISARIRERAGHRCECTGECGADHAEENDNYGFCPPGYSGYPDERCHARNYEAHAITGSKVVLTTAHLDHHPENCSDANLKSMCQRCHNKLDAPMRRSGIKHRAHQKSAIADLFQQPPHSQAEGR